jgi:uncharacterized membrane protein
VLITILKVIHVFSAIVALGANLTYEFWLSWGRRRPEQLPEIIRGIRALDRRVANPAYAVVLLSGVAMVLTGAYSFESGWIATSIVLYLAAVAIGIGAFAPAIRRQLAEAERDPTSSAYQAAARRTRSLGWLTVAIVGLIVILMVAKPF